MGPENTGRPSRSAYAAAGAALCVGWVVLAYWLPSLWGWRGVTGQYGVGAFVTAPPAVIVGALIGVCAAYVPSKTLSWVVLAAVALAAAASAYLAKGEPAQLVGWLSMLGPAFALVLVFFAAGIHVERTRP
jgi:hypothetical protein